MLSERECNDVRGCRVRKKTIEEYYALPEGTRAELIYGVIYDKNKITRTGFSGTPDFIIEIASSNAAQYIC